MMISAISADVDHQGEEVFDVYIRAKDQIELALTRLATDSLSRSR
jgi:hypothetical protein